MTTLQRCIELARSLPHGRLDTVSLKRQLDQIDDSRGAEAAA